ALRRGRGGVEAVDPLEDEVGTPVVAAGVEEARRDAAAVEVAEDLHLVCEKSRRGAGDLQRRDVVSAAELIDLRVVEELDAADDRPAGERAAAVVPGAELVVVVGAGGDEHAVVDEAPEAGEHRVEALRGVAA